MNTIAKETLKFLATMDDIDSITCKAFCDEEIRLEAGNLVGLYIKGFGIVLEPKYVSVQRFDDIIKVGVRDNEFVLYGGYSIITKSFVIPPLYSVLAFYDELKKYRSFTKGPHG